MWRKVSTRRDKNFRRFYGRPRRGRRGQAAASPPPSHTADGSTTVALSAADRPGGFPVHAARHNFLRHLLLLSDGPGVFHEPHRLEPPATAAIDRKSTRLNSSH